MTPLPTWFYVGADIQFNGHGPAYKVVSIDEEDGSWVAFDGLDKGRYPLDEVAKHWKPVRMS